MTSMSIRDVSLFVKVIGHGYPMVLMHGGPALDHTTLLPLQPLSWRVLSHFLMSRQASTGT